MKDIDDFNADEFLVRLGKNIAKIRTSKGYSQDRACLEAGFARGTLSKIERGLVEPKVTTIARLAIILGVPYKKLHEVELF